MVDLHKDKKPTIKEHYVAYFDILGYRDLVENNPDNLDSIHDTIFECFEKASYRLNLVNSLLNRFGLKENYFKYKVFSDNIIIYYEQDDEFLSSFVILAVIELLKDIQCELIYKCGIFIRGSVTKGLFAANNTYVFGPALIQAVKLENCALYPRIILDRCIIDELKTPIKGHSIEAQNIFNQLNNLFNSPFISTSSEEVYYRIQSITQITIYLISILIESKSDLQSLKDIFQKFSFISKLNITNQPNLLESQFQALKKKQLFYF